MASHSLREVSARSANDISELRDRSSPYHDQLFFAFRQAAEVCRGVGSLQTTAKIIDHALESADVPDSTRNPM